MCRILGYTKNERGEKVMPQDYNKTLNLPKTDFPMRAGLPKSEPVTLKRWQDNDTYNKLMELNEGKPLYVLHDGPPYANGAANLQWTRSKQIGTL